LKNDARVGLVPGVCEGVFGIERNETNNIRTHYCICSPMFFSLDMCTYAENSICIRSFGIVVRTVPSQPIREIKRVLPFCPSHSSLALFFFFFFFFLSTTVCRNRKRELCICTTIYVGLLHSNQPSRGRNKPVANVVETFNRAVAAIGENDDTPSILYRPIE
jgi:hypothetical protein